MDVQTERYLEPLDRVEVLAGPTGRRKWPDDVKGQLVAESFLPGVSVREVAKNSTAPIAQDGLNRIAELYAIEADIKGQSAEDRLAVRRERSVPCIDSFELWLNEHQARVSGKSPLGEALRYIARFWKGLILFLNDGRIEMDNNAVERTIRPIALNRKNALFAGHDAGARNWGIIASLIETAKLNKIEPQAYLTATLQAIVTGHRQSQIEQLLPWNFEAQISYV